MLGICAARSELAGVAAQLAKEAADGLREKFKTMIPLGRIGDAEEVASAAIFLASKESSFISGIDLPVDGGLVSV
jgi:NAD(P)-dependent dehydrogenase (short-subunit alcohol dehydrogenase family)